MYKHILFDLDGTLTDPAAGIISSLRHALAQMGVDEEDEEKFRLFIGPPLKDSFRTMYAFSEEQVDQAIAIYREHHGVSGLYENKVFPGIREMLADLRADGRKLYVATTKMTAFAELILKHFALDTYFTKIVGGHPDGTRTAKAEIIADILQDIPQAERQAVVMVGDRMFDVVGANAQGIDAIAVTYGYGQEEELQAENPTHIAHSVAELVTILRQV
ncbi:MAG TPA: HAD hydrolase-like protein [Oscillospiraceae bacterium]|nr:HAD hydrolase-like protein [Oscillospiraceae bacterium]